MRMRTLRMWYGLLFVWAEGCVKWIMRNVGARLKSYGRKFEYWGDDVTPRWGLKIFNKCYLADVEIHLDGNIFCGLIDSIYQDTSQKKQVLVIKLKYVTKRKDAFFDDPLETIDEQEFRLMGYGAPVVIKEMGYDCVWAGCDGGHIAIFFNRPLQNKKRE